jgi:hypothetical protein
MTFCADPAGLPAEADMLVVIHQDVALEAIAELARAQAAASLIVVTTHAFFPEEEERLRALCAPGQLWWLPMSWLLTDGQMEACDDRAVATLSARGGRIDVGGVMALSRRLRNEAAAERLRRQVHWRSAFAAQGLGIVAEVWTDAPPIAVPEPSAGAEHKPLIARMHEAATVEIVEAFGQRHIFMGSASRLRFHHDAKRHVCQPPLATAIGRGQGLRLMRRLTTGAVAAARRGTDAKAATTIHQYAPWMAEAFPDLLIFVDGLHQPNYPVSYGAAFRDLHVVSREECDRIWFEKCGAIVLPPAPILAPERPYGNPSKPRPVRNICLMLNHAGDWTALVDRSDTDLVVMEFVDAARRLPHLCFRVRPHPTMAMPEHEGVHSRERLEAWVRGQGLANLDISSGGAEEDLAWADLCVTEYSNMLVDCMKADMACLALNPTNRRNLLAHLGPRGLAEVKDGRSLADFIGTLSETAGHKRDTSLA